jgi:hypothetical protein
VEARAGIEPAHKGFADLSLTTWVPRLTAHTLNLAMQDSQIDLRSVPQKRCFWSGRPGSNRRHLPWQGSTLPLSYSRPANIEYIQNSDRPQWRYGCGLGVGAVAPGGTAGREGIAFGGIPFGGCVGCGAGCGGGGGGGNSMNVAVLGFGL